MLHFLHEPVDAGAELSNKDWNLFYRRILGLNSFKYFNYLCLVSTFWKECVIIKADCYSQNASGILAAYYNQFRAPEQHGAI